MRNLTGPDWISADEVFATLSYLDAIRAVQRDVRAGLDPAADFERQVLELANGQLLVMPAASAEFVGTKIASVAPGNPAVGRERIQGVYVLMDAATLTPVALLDGAAVTTLRTPAVSAAAGDLLAPTKVEHAVVFGTGPQAMGHIAAMRAVRAIARITVVARDAARAAAFAASVSGIQTVVGTAEAVKDAQLIVCATTARTPLFDGALVPTECCVIAVGSHEPDARELDSALLERSQVVVEDRTVALREAGDVVIAIGEGRLHPGSLAPLRDILTGVTSVDTARPRVFKSTGMAWEDLVIAAEVYRRRA